MGTQPVSGSERINNAPDKAMSGDRTPPDTKGRTYVLAPLPASGAPKVGQTVIGTACENLGNTDLPVSERSKALDFLIKEYPKTSADGKRLIASKMKEAFIAAKIAGSAPKEVTELRLKMLGAMAKLNNAYAPEVSAKISGVIDELKGLKLSTVFYAKKFNNKIPTSSIIDTVNPAMEILGRRNGEKGVADIQSEYKIPGGNNGVSFGNTTREKLIAELTPYAEAAKPGK